MLLAHPARPLTRAVPLIFAVTALACTDDSPVAPRVPVRPIALVATTVTVMNADDTGPGSLRQAIADAADGTTIQFDGSLAGKSIVLATGPLLINKALIIEGSASQGITISGGFSSLVMSIGATADVTLRNLSIVNGRTTDFAAGIYSVGNLTLDHALVADNESFGGDPGGGGIYSGERNLLVVNSTISDNLGGYGGGIDARGAVTIHNSTITGNSSAKGGGVHILGSALVRNSIIAYNVDRSANPVTANCDKFDGAWTFVGLNITTDNSCGTGAALFIADPMLDVLANNGGPTKTRALRLGSPAIDAGVQCTETTDQRYVDRPQGSSCDIGAYEYTYARLTLNAGPNAMLDRKAGVATVTGTVTRPEPGTFTLGVDLSQSQRITGRFDTVVQATASTIVFCNGTTSWSATLTPQTGSFQSGSATATVRTTTYPFAYLPASVTAPVRLFVVK